MSRARFAFAAAAVALAASAASAMRIDAERAAEEEAILAEVGMVVPCRFGAFFSSSVLAAERRRREVLVRYLMSTRDERRRRAFFSMSIRSATGPSDADLLAANRAILDDLVGPLTLVRDVSGPAGAVGRVYRFERRGGPALVGTILWRRGAWRIRIDAWAYGTRHEAVWADIERLVREIATPRHPRGRSRRCSDLIDAVPVPIPA